MKGGKRGVGDEILTAGGAGEMAGFHFRGRSLSNHLISRSPDPLITWSPRIAEKDERGSP